MGPERANTKKKTKKEKKTKKKSESSSKAAPTSFINPTKPRRRDKRGLGLVRAVLDFCLLVWGPFFVYH